MTERTRKRLLDLQARQDQDCRMLCPRCGSTELKKPVTTNALSRITELYVCDDCGTAEAMLAFMKQAYPLHQWYAFQPAIPAADFDSRPASEVLAQVIQKQTEELKRIFLLCRDDPEAAMEYRLEAFENCPGLSELWPEPFQAKFNAADGAVIIRYWSTEEGTIQMAAHIM